MCRVGALLLLPLAFAPHISSIAGEQVKVVEHDVVVGPNHLRPQSYERGSRMGEKLEESSSLRFVAVGDWGAPFESDEKYPDSDRLREGQRAVADGVASWLEQNANGGGDDDAFVLSLGDNFYPSGVKDANDMEERFRKSFAEVYDRHDAFADVPWYVVAGNKDYEGGADVTAQMNYAGDSRWVFPDYFHAVVREASGAGGVRVEIVMIDTMQLSGGIHYPKYTEGRSKHTSEKIADRGLKFIEDRLGESDADYLLVAGHFPPHSVDGLEKLLEKYDVSAYVGGHVHCQRHKRVNGVDYFISGAGMELDCDDDSIDEEDGTGGFLSFDANEDKLVVMFHDQDGKSLHHVDIGPRSSSRHGVGELDDAVAVA